MDKYRVGVRVVRSCPGVHVGWPKTHFYIYLTIIQMDKGKDIYSDEYYGSHCDSLVHVKFVPNCHFAKEVEVLAISNLRIVVILVGEEGEREGEREGGREGRSEEEKELTIASSPGSTSQTMGGVTWGRGYVHNQTTSHLQ